jgi:hypothetical protein
MWFTEHVRIKRNGELDVVTVKVSSPDIQIQEEDWMKEITEIYIPSQNISYWEEAHNIEDILSLLIKAVMRIHNRKCLDRIDYSPHREPDDNPTCCQKNYCGTSKCSSKSCHGRTK